MSNTTFNEEKNCPAYFKYEGKVYQCVGNDDNQFWAIIDGESKGFEQSNCIKLYPKTAYVASDFVTDISILVNGEICMVDHIKPYDFSTSVKDGYCVVFENEERCILETEESDIIKIFEPTYEAPPTPDVDLKDNMFMNGGNTDAEKSFYAMGYRDGQASTPDVTEAVEFAEWCLANYFRNHANQTWYTNLHTEYTTAELYSLFKNQKQ